MEIFIFYQLLIYWTSSLRKKKSFLPPESRDLQAVMALSTHFYHYSVLDSGQSQKNYNKRAVYIKLFLARECAWLTIEEREKVKRTKKLDQMRGSRPSSYILANTIWLARGKYRDKDLLYSVIRPVHAIGGYQGNYGKSV